QSSHALLGANRLDEAETMLQRAIDILVNLRQNLSDLYTISVLDTQVHTYNLLQQVLVAQTNYAKALEVAEQGRAQALIDLVAADNPSRNDWTTAAYADLQAVAQQQQATLVEYTLVPEDTFKFKFQAKQRGQTAQLFIWVIQPTGELHFQQQAISDLELPLESLIAQSRRNLAGDRGLWRSIQVAPLAEAAEIGEPLQRLHQILIAPIQDWLPTNPEAQVILIPHEALFLVPFAALQAADETALIEHHTLAIAPSIQLLAVSQSNASAASASALIVGNPVMPSLALSPGDTPQQLPPLLGAEQEAIAIAQLLKTDALLGEMATETRVAAQMEQAPLIHLATHGLLDLNLPTADFTQLQNPGAIALAPSTTADGWLTSPEIAALDLKADLVVLSACDTGLGEITGDGVVGLARSLLGAGAKSTVVSLWAVPDAPTAELMVAFYQQLFAGRGKAHALRQAMLHTKANHPNPRDWAAFVLIGNPG
ncbi:MAG: CHAT domain-containing protein, partial [Leptolyngbya sp. SIO4C5]|nr:CHAT domain-containing protein [Leptolyngbya sp. SIO4C5]